jgi:hypothetical protein
LASSSPAAPDLTIPAIPHKALPIAIAIAIAMAIPIVIAIISVQKPWSRDV